MRARISSLNGLTSFGLEVLAALLLTCGMAQGDDWPQWLGPKRDGIWRETGIVDKLPATPTYRWRVPIGGGYASPAVVDGKVFVTDRVLAPDARNPANAFARNVVAGKEGVSCLDDKTGKVLWRHEYDCPYEVSYAAGPRCTPVVDGGRVYTLGTMGDLLCLDTATGKVVWSVNFLRDRDARMSTWGFAAHPLIDGDRLICLVGGPKGLVVAFDKNTGREMWHALESKEVGYCPPMIYQIGARRELVIWYPEGVAGLDPESGKTIWQQPWKLHSSSMSISTPRFQAGELFLTSFYNGSLALEFDKSGEHPSILWKGKSFENPRLSSEEPKNTENLHSIIGTPVIAGDTIYGVCSYGQFRALDLKTGTRLWETFAPTSGKPERWGNAFIIPHEDKFFLFSEKGDLILAQLSPQGYDELGRMRIIAPTNMMAGRPVVWSHPAFANRSVYVRNDKELVCVSLAASP
jgi:outer membrane protein assembly factor BamB